MPLRLQTPNDVGGGDSLAIGDRTQHATPKGHAVHRLEDLRSEIITMDDDVDLVGIEQLISDHKRCRRDDVVNVSTGRDYCASLVVAHDRAALEARHIVVGVDAHPELRAEPARALEKRDVSPVEEVSDHVGVDPRSCRIAAYHGIARSSETPFDADGIDAFMNLYSASPTGT